MDLEWIPTRTEVFFTMEFGSKVSQFLTKCWGMMVGFHMNTAVTTWWNGGHDRDHKTQHNTGLLSTLSTNVLQEKEMVVCTEMDSMGGKLLF
jgi:hypothetical protein